MADTGKETSASSAADQIQPQKRSLNCEREDKSLEISASLLDQLTIDDSEEVNEIPDEPEAFDVHAVTSGDNPFTSAATFEDLNLSPELLKGLYVEMKFWKPSKIQAVSLPLILDPAYNDLIAQAHNGSGKTTCFAIGMLSRVDPNLKRPQALCICPTHELAIQNMEVVKKMGKYTGITSECAIPGRTREKGSSPAEKTLSQVVIGTPGTVKRLMSNKTLDVTNVKILVFDEADQMLATDGFQDDSLKTLKDIRKANPECQVLLFSATFDEAVKKFASRTVKDKHNQLFVKKEELSLGSLKQYKVTCSNEKAKILVVRERVIEFAEGMGRAIIFVNSKRNAATLHNALKEWGYNITTIHGARTAEERDTIVKEFRDGITQILISTDLLARGFDQEEVNLIVNYDLPVKYGKPNYDVYLHRINRAGRFGRKGAVFNLVMDDRDQMIMDKIAMYFETKITQVPPSNSEEDFKKALKEAGLD